MVRINLRDYYPFYKSDFFIETTNEILELFKQLHRKEHADFERRRIHKSYYSLDADDGIKKDIILLVISPEEIYERKMSNQELYAAINNLPEKQAKRIYAHFFLGMTNAEIAKIEGVSKSAVIHSINKASYSFSRPSARGSNEHAPAHRRFLYCGPNPGPQFKRSRYTVRNFDEP